MGELSGMIVRGPRRILVVTDRYPPETAGGGEISLHLLLRRLLVLGVEPTVAALSEIHTTLERTVHEELTVFRVPYAPTWPPDLHSRLPPAGVRFQAPKRAGALVAAMARYLRRASASTRSERLARLRVYVALLRRGLSRHMPLVDRDMLESDGVVENLERLVAELSPDVVHGDNYRGIVFAAEACPPEVPLTAMVRDNRFFCAERNQATNVDGIVCGRCDFQCTAPVPEPQRRRLEVLMRDDLELRRAALRRAAGVAVTSGFLCAQLSAIVDPRRIAVVSNPIDEPELVARWQDGVRPVEPPRILIVGMVNENKGQLQLLEWLPWLEAAGRDYTVALAGRGERLLARLREEARRAGMGERLVALGFLSRSELYREYARASVVAVPAVWPEPFGRVPLEAGLSRRPVVAFAVGALPENVVHGETGFLVPAGDNRAFVASLSALLADPDLAGRFGENAYRHVTSRFDLDGPARALCELWAGVSSARERPGVARALDGARDAV